MKKLLIVCAALASLGSALTASQASAGGFFGGHHGYGYGYGYGHDFDRHDFFRHDFRDFRRDFRRGR